MARLPRNPKFWLGGFLLWFAVLWTLSSGTHPDLPAPEIPNFDKIVHFGYFFGGAGLFSAWLFRRNPENPNWWAILVLTVIVVGLTGMLDEYHQGFVPGRRGNDPVDLIADVLGAIAGALVFRRFHHQLK
jgi:VanZ family protein